MSGSATARLLRSRIRIRLSAWIFISCVHFMFGLCDEPILHSEESYQIATNDAARSVVSVRQHTHIQKKSVSFLSTVLQAGRSRFDSRWCSWNFYGLNPSRHTTAMGMTQNSNRQEYQAYFLWSKKRPLRRADNFTTFMYWLSRNSGSHNLLQP